jgi:hypothetical protein
LGRLRDVEAVLGARGEPPPDQAGDDRREGPQQQPAHVLPGDVLGIAVLVGGPASVEVQAVESSGLFRLSSRTLLAAARRDAAS